MQPRGGRAREAQRVFRTELSDRPDCCSRASHCCLTSRRAAASDPRRVAKSGKCVGLGFEPCSNISIYRGFQFSARLGKGPWDVSRRWEDELRYCRLKRVPGSGFPARCRPDLRRLQRLRLKCIRLITQIRHPVAARLKRRPPSILSALDCHQWDCFGLCFRHSITAGR